MDRALRISVLLTSLAFGACNCEAGRELSTRNGKISVDPERIDFGEVVVNEESIRTIDVQNIGDYGLEIFGTEISGSNAFAVAQTGAPSLEPSSGTTMAISFVPAAVGPWSATLTISTDGNPETATVELTGTGVDRPPPPLNCTLSVAPAAIDFGSIPVGGSSDQTVTVTNTSAASCTIERFELAGMSAADFTIVSSMAGTLAAGASTSVVVRLTRSSVQNVSAELDVYSNDAAIPVHRVLMFAGSIGMGLCVTPLSVHFSATLGTATQDVTLTACGAFDVQISAIEWTLVANELGLLAPPGTPFTLPMGTSRVVTVRYAPVDQTDDHAVLTIRSNDPLAPAIDVDVTGSPEIVPEEVGRYLYFWQIDASQLSDIVRLPLQGMQAALPYWGQRAGTNFGCPGCHHVSPDGVYVAVVEFGLLGQNLYVVDTRTDRKVTLPAQVSAGSSFAWKRDVNSAPSYQYAVGAEGKIHLGSLTGGYIGELAGANNPAYENAMPSWGPNGEIVFVRGGADLEHPGFGFTGGADLMTVPEGGGTAVALPGASMNGMSNYYPAYSPNGLWISFTQSGSGVTYAAADAHVRLVRADHSGTVLQLPLINGNNGATSFPTWSIDGTYLSISSNRSGGVGDWDIYIAAIDPVTGAETAPMNLRTANTAGFEHAAQWSP